MTFKKTNFYWYLSRRCRKNNIRKDGHSQYGQDVTVWELLGRLTHGVFVDIGANDGVTFSNSLLFEEKGWDGICVEPHPVMFKKLQEKRKCNLVNSCIAGEDGIVNFLVVEGSENMRSGILEFLDQHNIELIDKGIAEHGGSKRTEPIEAISPQTLLERFNIQQIDYLSIDTEGCELQILRQFDFKKIPVKIISIENGDRKPSVFNYMTRINYELVKTVGCDEIYCKK